jgi:ribose 5-phosphate isomerase B
MRVVIGSDHGGFELKQDLVKYIESLGIPVTDFGTYSKDPVDYPDIAHLVASKVAADPEFVGVIIDGAGVGSCMTANKVPGVRAAHCHCTFTARNSREHNDANVLTLGARVLGPGLAQEIVKTWLGCSFLGDRHARRVEKIMIVEKKYCRS